MDSSAVTSSHDYKLRHLPAQEQNWDIGNYKITVQTLESDVATGTAPFTVASTTVVANLNADKLDGQEGSYYTDLSNIDAGTLALARGGTNKDNSGDAQGAILFNDGSGYDGLASGTSGQFLKTQGAGANPIWAFPYEIITGTYTGDGTDDRTITIGFTDTTKTPKLVFVRSKDSNDNRSPWVRCDQDDSNRSWWGSAQRYNTTDMGNKIQSFAANSFVIGSNGDVNANGDTFMFIAIG